MIELVIVVISTVGGLFIFQQLTRLNNSKHQAELESKVKELDSRAAILADSNKKTDKETQDKVDVITKEQDKPITSNDLIDFFNNRKGGK